MFCSHVSPYHLLAFLLSYNCTQSLKNAMELCASSSYLILKKWIPQAQSVPSIINRPGIFAHSSNKERHFAVTLGGKAHSLSDFHPAHAFPYLCLGSRISPDLSEALTLQRLQFPIKSLWNLSRHLPRTIFNLDKEECFQSP